MLDFLLSPWYTAAYNLPWDHQSLTLRASPQLEWWNAGISEKWESACGAERILQYWENRKIGLDLKVRMDKILQKPNNPSFHDSIIFTP